MGFNPHKKTAVLLVVVARLVCTAFSSYSESALHNPQKVRDSISRLSQSETRAALEELLRSPEQEVRLFAVKEINKAYDTTIISALTRADATETAPDVSAEITSALNRLRAYRSIELPEAEITAFAVPQEEQGHAAEAIVHVMDWSGQDVEYAEVSAYSREYNLRVPVHSSQHFKTGANGLAALPLARGKWIITASSPASYQKRRKGRGVFLQSEVELSKPRHRIVMRPDSEIRLTFEKGTDAEEIYAADPALVHTIQTASLGSSRKSRFVLETNKKNSIRIFGADTDQGASWAFCEKTVSAPASVSIAPPSAVLRFSALHPLPSGSPLKITLFNCLHTATPLCFDVNAGDSLRIPGGEAELAYSVQTGTQRFRFGPMPFYFHPGHTIPLTLAPPEQIWVMHDFFKDYAGQKNVLSARLSATAANGHLLSEAAPGCSSIRILNNGNLIAESAVHTNGLSATVVGIAASFPGHLSYETDAGFPYSTALCRSGTVETEHFRLTGPDSAKEKIGLLGQSAEKAYSVICDLLEDSPIHRKKDIRICTSLPPTVDATATAEGLNIRMESLLNSRHLNFMVPETLSHELLHLCGFEHGDYMDIWQTDIRSRMLQADIPDAVLLPPPFMQRQTLAFLRGENGVHGAAVPWIIRRHCGMEPFRFYLNKKTAWKTALQIHGATDDEADCIIFSEATGRDLRPLYRQAGIRIRTRIVETADPIIQEITDGTASKPFVNESEKISAMYADIRKMTHTQAAETLAAHQAVITAIPLHRERVRHHMRFAVLFHALTEKSKTHESLKLAQRAALKVNKAYFEQVRELSVDLLTGKPVFLGHL